jgi:hypothetical protein
MDASSWDGIGLCRTREIRPDAGPGLTVPFTPAGLTKNDLGTLNEFNYSNYFVYYRYVSRFILKGFPYPIFRKDAVFDLFI